MNNQTLHIKELEREEKIRPSVSRKKETIRIIVEVNKIETR